MNNGIYNAVTFTDPGNSQQYVGYRMRHTTGQAPDATDIHTDPPGSTAEEPHSPTSEPSIEYSTSRGWYVVAESTNRNEEGDCYLHRDGVWRGSTQSEDGDFTGYYATHDDAFASLSKWRPDAAAPAPSAPHGLLGGFGNAIVPQVAAEFVAAFMDVERGVVA